MAALAAVALAGCGGSSGDLLSASAAAQLKADLTQAENAIDDQDCSGAQSALSNFQTTVGGLSGVNATALGNLTRAVEQTQQRLSSSCGSSDTTHTDTRTDTDTDSTPTDTNPSTRTDTETRTRPQTTTTSTGSGGTTLPQTTNTSTATTSTRSTPTTSTGASPTTSTSSTSSTSTSTSGGDGLISGSGQ